MQKQLKELFLLHFLNDGVRTTFVVLLPFIAKELSLNLTAVGLLGSSLALLVAILAFPAGFLASRFGGLHLLASVLLVYSLGALTVGFSPNILILAPAFILGALGFGMFHTVGFALTAKISDEKNIGRNMGNFTSIGEIGRVAVPPLAIFITSLLTWRITMVGLAAIGIVLFFVLRFFLPKTDVYTISEEKEHYKDFLKTTLLFFKLKNVLLVTISAIIDSLASNAIYIFLPFLLLAKGIQPAQLSIAMGGFFVGSLVGKSMLGRGVDRLGNKKIFILSEVAMAVILVLLVLSSHLLLLFLFASLLGIFTKGTSPVIQTMFSELTHKKHYNKIYAISEITIGAAATVATLLMGVIADHLGITTVFYVSALFAITAVLPITLLVRLAKSQ